MRSDSSAVDAAVLAQLSADADLSALVNGAFYFDEAPQGLTRFVLVKQSTHVDEPMQPGATAFEQFLYFVQAIMAGTSGADVRTAAALIHDRLHFQDFPIDGYALMVSKRRERIRYVDRDDLNNEWQHRGGVYEVMVHPREAPPPPSAYADVVLADGPIHYWRLGEATGAVAADEVGAAPGTISGGVTLGEPGPLGDGSTAMTFDGATGSIATPAVMVPATFSVETWIKLPGVANGPFFSTYSSILATVYLAIGVPGAPSQGLYYYEVPGPSIPGDYQALSLGAWHHVVVTHDATTLAFYVDAAAPQTFPAARSVGASDVASIGSSAFAGTHIGASLAEVALYPTALSPTQIANHYAARSVARSRSRIRT